MEMRLLNTEGERNVFAQMLADARAGHGASYRDAGESHARNMVRLAAADIYGLFETECGRAEHMIAGVALHDLAVYPQSCMQPDLSGYAPRSVLECSDHWSLSRGAGMHAWRGIAVQVVHRNPRAVLVYLAARIRPQRILHGDGLRQRGHAGRVPISRRARRATMGSADDPRRRSVGETDLKCASVEDRNSGQLSDNPFRQLRPAEAGDESLSAQHRRDDRRIRSSLNLPPIDPAD